MTYLLKGITKAVIYIVILIPVGLAVEFISALQKFGGAKTTYKDKINNKQND
jgi:hypothetical protein